MAHGVYIITVHAYSLQGYAFPACSCVDFTHIHAITSFFSLGAAFRRAILCSVAVTVFGPRMLTLQLTAVAQHYWITRLIHWILMAALLRAWYFTEPTTVSLTTAVWSLSETLKPTHRWRHHVVIRHWPIFRITSLARSAVNIYVKRISAQLVKH